MKINNILIAGLLTYSLSACTLEHEDYTQISPETFPKTENDLKLSVNALYTAFGTNWGLVNEAGSKGYQVLSDMTTDATWCSWGWNWDISHYLQWDKTTSADGIWDAFTRYNFLSQARNVIRRIEATEGVSTAAKAELKAEAEALRGWMGLYLYDLFGPVPVPSDEILDAPQTLVQLPRLTDEEFDAWMVNDLTDAIANLPEQNETGRMTKGAARMLLMKYYMMRGKYEEALQVCRDLYAMEGNVYNLQPSYSRIFDQANEHNDEVILSIECNSAIDWCSNILMAECLPTDWNVENATGWEGYVMPWAFYDTYEKSDLRLERIITSYTGKDGVEHSRENPNGNTQLPKGAIMLKYSDANQIDSRIDNDLIIYRYSDVLLSLAELIVRTDGNVTNEAASLVNRVRARSGLKPLAAEITSDKTKFMDALLLERGHEFFLEGLRRQDLIRFGKYIDYANQRIDAANAAGSNYHRIDDSRCRFPIPQNYIDESKGMIIQNPGY